MVFGITGNTLKNELDAVIEKFLLYLVENKIDFVLHDELSSVINNFNFLPNKSLLTSKQLINQSDILLIFGGDGTILSFARTMEEPKIPILGVDLGKLGFLAEVTVTEIYTFIHDLISGNYIIEQRSMLEANIHHDKDYRFRAMNDIVISRTQTSRLRLLHIEAKINGDYLITTMSDGIIVATPTGSTAYSLSANGPIVAPPCKVMIINPICPHVLTVRPIIIPDDCVVTAKVDYSTNEDVMVTADGQGEAILKTPFEIYIKKSDFPVKLIRKKSVSYYEILRSKLMWGKDLRTHEN
jgi:NAD+ kinase